MISKRYLIIGARSSKLALWQAEFVAAKLREVLPSMPVIIKPIMTSGDRDLATALSEFGSNGTFTDALETALCNGEIDLAVHSLKDVPTSIDEQFVIGGVPQRASPYDALISRQHHKLHELPRGAKIGTDSLHRSAQLLALRPDVEIMPLRGSVPARLAALTMPASPYDALVMAVAGLERLRLTAHITELLTPEVMLPAAGQGAIAVQCRADDQPLRHILTRVDDMTAHIEVEAERALQTTLEANCRLPIAALARLNHHDSLLSLTGRVVSPAGDTNVTVRAALDLREADLRAPNDPLFAYVRAAAQQLGQTWAAQMIWQPAGDLLWVGE